jgi:flagellar biosynthesis activator protein FlaF
MQTAKSAEPLDRDLFDEALTNNRKLWTLLVTSATRPENPLPHEIKQNIANLGVFVLGRIFDLTVKPQPEKLDILISINREIAAGLRAQPPAEALPA